MNDQLPPQPAGTGQIPNAQPAKKQSWIFWVLGGAAALSCLCIVVGIVVMGMLTMMGSRVSQVFTNISSGLEATSIALEPEAPSGSGSAPIAPASGPIYDPEADAQDDIDQALALAKKGNKRVILDFGADWCADCVVLSQFLESKKVKPYLDEHFELVRINVGQWDTNLDISKKYGDPIAKGIPAVVVLDANGKMIDSTGAGELANARTITEQELLDILKKWAEQK